MKKVILTGPTGAIGIALAQILEKQNIEVTAVCHRGSQRICRLPSSPKVKIVECNLNEIGKLPELLPHDYDVFYHFAWACTNGEARNDLKEQLKNIQYTLDAVEAAAKLGCSRFIGAGSQAEYGRYEGALNVSVPTFPENGYGIAKLCAGQMSRLRCEQLGIQHIWTRILSIFGPGDGETTLISSLILQLLHRERPKCTKGQQLWDYLYSKDAAAAFCLLGEKGISGKTYCLGSGMAQPLYKYIDCIRDLIDPSAKIDLGAIPYSPKQVMHLQADITELTEDTGFRPRYSFREAIAETIEWTKDVYL